MKEDSIHIVKLSNYVQPEIKEEYGKDYVTYGKKNSYFQYLIDRSMGSATNGSVINSIVDMVYGKGLTATNKAMKPDEYAQMKSLFKEEDLRRIINDLVRMGNCSAQTTTKGGGKKVDTFNHIPVETLAAEKLEEDSTDIQGYYHSYDWSKVKNTDDLKRIDSFDVAPKGNAVLYMKPYVSGMYYYSAPRYQGGLQYAELEEEIGNFHVNNVKNAFAPSMLINFNNGEANTEEKRRSVVRSVRQKYEGSSNSGKVIISFNDNAEAAATIEAIQLSDASDQYQFLSDECMRKILVAHRVTSPLLLGISTNTGFGSNADELKTASLLFEALVIQPFRNLIIDGLNKILRHNELSLDLEFESLNPFDKEEAVEAVKMNSEKLKPQFDDQEMYEALAPFGEDEDLEGWELIEEADVDYEKDDELNAQLNLASTGVARPNQKSEQDGEGAKGQEYRVRYQYSPLKTSENSRSFCKMMVAANKVYRKEDIEQMGDKPVNRGWGKGGADTYSVWKYKGGGGCGHSWRRKVYRKRYGDKRAQQVSVAEAARSGFRPEKNDSIVSIQPGATPTGQFLDGREWTPQINK